MTDQNEKNENVSEAFQNLGNNLSDFFQTAWESQERKDIQEDIEKGFSKAGESIQKAADDFAQTETGQKLKTDLDDIRARIESGELEEKAKSEILEIVEKVSSAIEGATKRWTGNDSDAE